MSLTSTRRWTLALVVLVLALTHLGSVMAQGELLPPWRQDLPSERQTAEIVVGEVPVPVELALDPAEQQLGLGYRNGLDEGSGMLFIFDQPQLLTFWMKGMRFCLDIIWINDGEIIAAAESVCPDPEGTEDVDRARFAAPGNADMVLEMDAGWMQANGLGAGTRIEFPDDLPARANFLLP